MNLEEKIEQFRYCSKRHFYDYYNYRMSRCDYCKFYDYMVNGAAEFTWIGRDGDNIVITNLDSRNVRYKIPQIIKLLDEADPAIRLTSKYRFIREWNL